MARYCSYCNRVLPRRTAFRGDCCWNCYQKAKGLPEGCFIFFLRNVKRPDGKFDSIPEQGTILQVIKRHLPSKSGIFRYKVSDGYKFYWVSEKNLSVDLHEITERSREVNKRRRAKRDAELDND